MSSTKYVDGYVLTIPKDKVDEYKKMAEEAVEIWMKHGALSYKECMLDDEQPMKEVTFTFPVMAKAKADETVWFSYIEYKDRAHRDEVNAKVMKEMEEYQKENPDHMDDMPFDMQRFAFGGFTVQVSN